MNEYIFVINTSDKPLSFYLTDQIPQNKANLAYFVFIYSKFLYSLIYLIYDS